MRRIVAGGLGSAVAPLSLIAAAVLLAGCKAPLLRELDADMPSAIVKLYEQSDKAYVDTGHLWVPCITAIGMRVSKTEEGYHGTGNFEAGPLGVLVLGRQSSDYNGQGLLLRYSVRATALWGVLLADSFNREFDGEKGKWDEQWSRKLFFGLLGYEGDSRGQRAAYFLFIPIVTSQGPKVCHDHDRERGNEHEEGQDDRMAEPPERHPTGLVTRN